jgi:hypothetical protein
MWWRKENTNLYQPTSFGTLRLLHTLPAICTSRLTEVNEQNNGTNCTGASIIACATTSCPFVQLPDGVSQTTAAIVTIIILTILGIAVFFIARYSSSMPIMPMSMLARMCLNAMVMISAIAGVDKNVKLIAPFKSWLAHSLQLMYDS